MTTSLLERSLNSVWHPCTQMQQHQDIESADWLPMIAIERAKGTWLYDFDGRGYLDGISSWWTNLFGHANPQINAAITEQLSRLEHVMLAGFTHQPVVELSERLAARTQNRLGHAFYASDGASAVEIALKISMHYWKNAGYPTKSHYVCVAGSYHGETVGALAVTDVSIFTAAYVPLIRPAFVTPSPDPRVDDQADAAEIARSAAASLAQLLEQQHQNIAAIIVEPMVQCAGGMIIYDAVYLQELRALCDHYQIHLIADEIAVGFGRTGTFFAHEHAAITPDLLCLSKGLTGGYLPLSAVLSSDNIYQQFLDATVDRAFLHSHSYTGNPLACSAALASLSLFDQSPVLQSNQQLSDYLWSALSDQLASHPAVKHLRRCGMIFAFDVDSQDRHFSRKFYRAALAEQALIRPLGNTVYLMPPYTISTGELDLLAAATHRALLSALSQ